MFPPRATVMVGFGVADKAIALAGGLLQWTQIVSNDAVACYPGPLGKVGRGLPPGGDGLSGDPPPPRVEGHPLSSSGSVDPRGTPRACWLSRTSPPPSAPHPAMATSMLVLTIPIRVKPVQIQDDASKTMWTRRSTRWWRSRRRIDRQYWYYFRNGCLRPQCGQHTWRGIRGLMILISSLSTIWCPPFPTDTYAPGRRGIKTDCRDPAQTPPAASGGLEAQHRSPADGPTNLGRCSKKSDSRNLGSRDSRAQRIWERPTNSPCTVFLRG